MSNPMPAQNPGKSEQVVVTPDEFISATLKRLGQPYFTFDLAANSSNTKAHKWYDESDNSLYQPWNPSESKYIDNTFCWVNPPYSDIGAWVEKAWNERNKGAKVAMLIPSSTGSNYWAKWVDGKAYVTFLNGRIQFVGHKTGYPKDLVLLLYAPYLNGGSCVWRWKDDI